MKLIQRLALCVLPALFAAGCAMPASTSTPASSGSGGLLGGQGRTGAMCVGDSQPCADAPCCDGMTCTPNGRLGMLCRRPMPN
jgi:hypothetical protein